jgi:hypothetical protein
MYPVIFYLATKFGGPVVRRVILGELIPIYSVYNFLYTTSVALVIAIKKEQKCKEKFK